MDIIMVLKIKCHFKVIPLPPYFQEIIAKACSIYYWMHNSDSWNIFFWKLNNYGWFSDLFVLNTDELCLNILSLTTNLDDMFSFTSSPTSVMPNLWLHYCSNPYYIATLYALCEEYKHERLIILFSPIGKRLYFLLALKLFCVPSICF